MAIIKRTRRKARNLEHERLTSLINSMGDAVIAVDEKLHVVVYNGAALDILDSNSSMQGKSIIGIFKPVDKLNKPVDVVGLIKNAQTPQTSRDYSLVYADGSTTRLYLSIAPVHLGYGKRGDRGYVILLRDITREKSLEEERNEFISVVSHELRTPIAIAEGNIGNALFVAEKTGDMTQVIAALKDAHAQTLFLAGMINDLSTLSRAQRGKLQVEIEPIDVSALVQQIATNYKTQAEDKQLTLSAAAVTDDIVLSSSRLYVQEVLQNFVTNAIKYTEAGSVHIKAENAPGGVRITITDTGIGISKSDQEKIFDKFFRSEDYRTRRTGGTGLGLYVTHKLLRLLHAELEVKSKLNKGSSFIVTFPDLH